MNFYKVKKRSIDMMRQSFPNDSEAMRHHGGRFKQQQGAAPGQGFQCSFLDASFVFDIASIQRLTKPKSGMEPDGVIIFLGSRNMEDSVDQVNSTSDHTCYLDVDGRPTLIAFPFKYIEEPNWDSNEPTTIDISLDEGEEHHGTGGTAVVATGVTTTLEVGPQPNEASLPIPRQIQRHYPLRDIEHLQS